jgi:pSer/pThr/pTyr-binding forkhead associated (FHA) protein
MPESKILKIRVSLKGRPVKTYSFGQETVLIGRSPDCDVVLDNPSVSREHVKIVRGPGGHYQAEDLGSANGTYLNDERLQREYLMSDDVLRIGKFSLWMRYDGDRRGDREDPASGTEEVMQGTTVLSPNDLQRMIANTRAAEERSRYEDQERPARAPAAAQAAHSERFWLTVAVVAFLLGTAFGAGASRLLAG